MMMRLPAAAATLRLARLYSRRCGIFQLSAIRLPSPPFFPCIAAIASVSTETGGTSKLSGDATFRDAGMRDRCGVHGCAAWDCRALERNFAKAKVRLTRFRVERRQMPCPNGLLALRRLYARPGARLAARAPNAKQLSYNDLAPAFTRHWRSEGRPTRERGKPVGIHRNRWSLSLPVLQQQRAAGWSRACLPRA